MGFGFFGISDLEDSIKEGDFQIIETEILNHKPVIEYFIVGKKK